MPRSVAQPLGTIHLSFRPGSRTADDLSVVERAGACLFVASDEGAELVRLVTRDGAAYREDAVFPLAGFFDLPVTKRTPGGPRTEADIEGMAVSGDWLWVVGSHSLARERPRPQGHDTPALARLSEVRRDPNRFLLGRIPLRVEGDGLALPLREDAERRPRCLDFRDDGNTLTKFLKNDEHLGRFLGIPAKENGFDVEGIAAHGDRLFLGLRGPVLRGWACVLELQVKDDPDRPNRLKLRRVGPNGARYRKHFLHLGGLGVRELAFDGDDLVILAGPTMDLDGPVSLWRWTDALSATDEQVVPTGQLVHLLDLPYGDGCDHAEGIVRLARAGAGPLLLVVYDSPGEDRLYDDGSVDADLFALPSRYDPTNAFRA